MGRLIARLNIDGLPAAFAEEAGGRKLAKMSNIAHLRGGLGEALWAFRDQEGAILVVSAPACRERNLDLATVGGEDAGGRRLGPPLKDQVGQEASPNTREGLVDVDDLLDQGFAGPADLDRAKTVA